LHGEYLVCPAADSANPEIYLLLDVGQEQWGICVNREYPVSAEEIKTDKPTTFAITFSKRYEAKGFVAKPKGRIFLPILQGGHSHKGLFVLHTALPGTQDKKIINNMYRLSTLVDFFEKTKLVPHNGFIQFVNGYRKFGPSEIKEGIARHGWSVRMGMHAFTYGVNLEEKAKRLSELKPNPLSGSATGGLDFAKMMQSMMAMSHEAAPSIMHASVAGYLLKFNPELDPKARHETVRMMIAISETEGNDVAQVMRKYTAQEIISKYDDVIAGGFELKMLESFDRRISMLESFWLNPLFYDSITTDLFMAQSRKETKTGGRSARADDLAETINQVAQIATTKGKDAGEA